MIVSLRDFFGWLVSSFSCRTDLVLENLALRRQLLASAQRPRRWLTALHKLFWVALRMCWSGWKQPLVLVTPRTVVNWQRARFRLYWIWFPESDKQEDGSVSAKRFAPWSFLWLLRIRPGSTAYSRRTAQAGFRSLGKECLAMDPASPEKSRPGEAMADVPQKPSRGHCCDGLFHRPNAHFWCSVLLFRHRPRPA